MAVAMGGCDFPGVGQSEGKEDPRESMGVGDSQHEWRKDSAGQRLGGMAMKMKYQRPRTRCFQDTFRSNQCSPRLQSSLVVLEIGKLWPTGFCGYKVILGS